jgi:hypothetical protein
VRGWPEKYKDAQGRDAVAPLPGRAKLAGDTWARGTNLVGKVTRGHVDKVTCGQGERLGGDAVAPLPSNGIGLVGYRLFFLQLDRPIDVPV